MWLFSHVQGASVLFGTSVPMLANQNYTTQSVQGNNWLCVRLHIDYDI